MDTVGKNGEGERKLLERVVLRSYKVPGGLTFGITHTTRCGNRNRNDEILHAVEKTNPKVMMEFEFALKGVMITIGCNECGIDKNQTAGLLMDNHSDQSSFESIGTTYTSEGTGSLFSEHLMTGNQGEETRGREIKIGGNNEAVNYSSSWPSSLDIGSSERNLYKGFKTDRSSDGDYHPPGEVIRKLEEIRDTPMNLGDNKTTEKTGMGDSKHATTKDVSMTPEVANKRVNRFKRESIRDSIEKEPVTETQITQPSTVPYGGSSVNDALLEAIGELESGQVVPAVEDIMETEEEDEVIVESMLSDHDRIRRLEDMVMTLKRAMIKGREEMDDEMEKLRYEVKTGKISCDNCTKDKGKGKEVAEKTKNIPYIPKQILKREEVPTLIAPIIRRDWNEERGEWKERETFAEKTRKANPQGFTEVVSKNNGKKMTKLGELKKVFVAPERERRLSIRFNRRKNGKQGLPEEINTETVRTALNETLKDLNVEGYFAKADRTRMGDVHMCLSKTRAANIVGAKEAMTDCLKQLGLQEFNFVPDTKKVKVYINDVPLKRDGFGEDWEPEDWYSEGAFDSLAADIERSNPGIFICARPSWVGKLHVIKNRKSWKAGLTILCEETDSLKIVLGKQNPKLIVGGRNRFCRVWRENAGTVICDKCLKTGHGGAECRSKAVCKWCRKDHHTSIHKCPIVDCAAPKGMCCMHCTRMCTLCDKTDHYTGYRECSVLQNARSTPPRYGKATPVDDDANAVDGITDNSRLRLEKAGREIRKTPIGEQAANLKQEGDNMTRPTNRIRSSSSPPTNSSNKENESPSGW